MSKKLYEETNIQAIANAIREKNHTQNKYTTAQMPNAILAIETEPDLQSKNITPGASQQVVEPDNGYDGLSTVTIAGDADLVAGNIKKDVEIFGVTGSYEGSGSPTLQAKTATQNGVVLPDSGYDGLSQVTVNVSGGGSSNVLFGDDVPTTSLGSDGDYYIREGTAKKWIRIDITKAARDTDYNFYYYGSRAISLVCKDTEQNEIEISPYIVEQKYWNGSSLSPGGGYTTVFRSDMGSYVENNSLPGHYAALYSIPNSFVLHKIKLTRRNNNSYHDYWRTFDIYQCDISGNNLSLLLSEQDLTESDWNDWDSFTEFTPTGQLVPTQSLHEVYHKENGIWAAI